MRAIRNRPPQREELERLLTADYIANGGQIHTAPGVVLVCVVCRRTRTVGPSPPPYRLCCRHCGGSLRAR